jgi:hypothetical protein
VVSQIPELWHQLIGSTQAISYFSTVEGSTFNASAVGS